MDRFRTGVCVFLLALGTRASFGQNEQPAKPPAQPAPRTVPNQVQLFIPYKQYSQEENQRILKLYEPLRVSDASDGMDTVGLQDIGIVDESIRPLWKDTENFTHRIVGIAVTARYVPTNKRLAKTSDKDVENWYDNITGEPYMDALFPGCVLVIDAEGDNDTRSIGSPIFSIGKNLECAALSPAEASPTAMKLFIIRSRPITNEWAEAFDRDAMKLNL